MGRVGVYVQSIVGSRRVLAQLWAAKSEFMYDRSMVGRRRVLAQLWAAESEFTYDRSSEVNGGSNYDSLKQRWDSAGRQRRPVKMSKCC